GEEDEGAHFYGDVEGDGKGDERPKQRVAVGAAGLGVGSDAAGVVIDVGGNDAGADDRKEKGDAAPELVAGGEEGQRAAADAVDDIVDCGQDHAFTSGQT